MSKLNRSLRWASLVFLLGLLGIAVSGCIPYHGSGGHSSTPGKHAH